jgi:hypothetical protein
LCFICQLLLPSPSKWVKHVQMAHDDAYGDDDDRSDKATWALLVNKKPENIDLEDVSSASSMSSSLSILDDVSSASSMANSLPSLEDVAFSFKSGVRLLRAVDAKLSVKS